MTTLPETKYYVVDGADTRYLAESIPLDLMREYNLVENDLDFIMNVPQFFKFSLALRKVYDSRTIAGSMARTYDAQFRNVSRRENIKELDNLCIDAGNLLRKFVDLMERRPDDDKCRYYIDTLLNKLSKISSIIERIGSVYGSDKATLVGFKNIGSEFSKLANSMDDVPVVKDEPFKKLNSMETTALLISSMAKDATTGDIYEQDTTSPEIKSEPLSRSEHEAVPKRFASESDMLSNFVEHRFDVDIEGSLDQDDLEEFKRFVHSPGLSDVVPSILKKKKEKQNSVSQPSAILRRKKSERRILRKGQGRGMERRERYPAKSYMCAEPHRLMERLKRTRQEDIEEKKRENAQRSHRG